MKKKFSIYYPVDHPNQDLAGKKFNTNKKGRSVVMTDKGCFLVITSPSYYDTYVGKLSDYIDGGKFDVVWEK